MSGLELFLIVLASNVLVEIVKTSLIYVYMIYRNRKIKKITEDIAKSLTEALEAYAEENPDGFNTDKPTKSNLH